LYNNVNKELHLQELYSSARASRNSQKCFEKLLQEAFLLKQSTCLSSLWLYISKLHFRYGFRYCAIVLLNYLRWFNQVSSRWLRV